MEDQAGPTQGEPDDQAPALGITRRALLASSSMAALTLSLIPIGASVSRPWNAPGEPFDDGTFFDDGTGWVD